MGAEHPDPEDLAAKERELAERRVALEAEFKAKFRDLKAQEKRRLDHLERDRVEWEDHKRKQAQELADRAERLRRQETNTVQREEAKGASRDELDRLRSEVEEQRAAKLEAKAAVAKLEVRLAEEQTRLRSGSRLLGWFGASSVAAGAVWLALAWGPAQGSGVAWAAGFLLLALVLNLLRFRLR